MSKAPHDEGSLNMLDWLDDTLLAVLLSHTSSAAATGCAAATCHRLRALCSADGPVWRLLLFISSAKGVPRWLTPGSAPVPLHASDAAHQARAIAMEPLGVLFDAGDQLVLLPLPGPAALPGPPPPPLVLREAWACAQAACGEVALAIHRADDLRRGSVNFAPLLPAGSRAARVTKVRCVSTKGANRRSIRFGGTLSALAAGDGLVATARRGSGIVQLWHAESGALVGQATAHAEGATIFAMALRGGLLLAAGTEAAIAMHATRAATAHAWLTTARSTSSTAAADAADDSAPTTAPPAASVVATSSCVSGEDAGELAGGSGATGTGSIGGLGFGGRAGGGSAMAPACPSCVQLCRATGHLEAVACLELHGGWLLSGAQDGRVLVHAAGRPKPFLALPAAHTAPVVNIFGAGSSCMLSVGRDGSARLWELPSGSCLRELNLLSAPALAPAPAASSILIAPNRGAAAALAFQEMRPSAVYGSHLRISADGGVGASSSHGAETDDVARVAASSSPMKPLTPAMAAAAAATAAAAAAAAALAQSSTSLVSAAPHLEGLVSLSSDGHVLLWRWPEGAASGSGGTASVQGYYEVAGVATAPLRADAPAPPRERSGAAPDAGGAAMEVEAEAAAGMGSRVELVQQVLGRGIDEVTEADGGGSRAIGSLSGFSAARVQQRIQRLAPSVAAGASEFMAAVLEVVASQMLQRAGDAAAVENCGRIEPHHIRVAVRQDNDLSRLVGEDALAQGGLLCPGDGEASPAASERPMGESTGESPEAGAEEAAADEADSADSVDEPLAAEASSARAVHPTLAGCALASGDTSSWPASGSAGAAESSVTGMGVEGRAGSLSGFSAARVQQRIQRLAPNVAADAPEFMAAVLEVVASQMLQRAGDAAAVENCGRIEPHHIRMAVRQDNDLSRLVGEDALAQGGLLRPAESDDEQGD